MKVQVELIVDKILKALKVSVLVESFLLLLFDKMFFKVLTLPPSSFCAHFFCRVGFRLGGKGWIRDLSY